MTTLRSTAALVTSALVVAGLLAVPAAANAADFAASISGHVSAPAGADLSVTLYDDSHEPVDETTPDAAGAYSFAIDGPGDYAISLSDDRLEGSFVTRFFPGNLIASDSDDPAVTYYPVADGAVLTDVDIALSLATFSGITTPTISGTPRFGKDLIVSVGGADDLTDLEYQWLRGSTPIADATDDTYTIAAEDVGGTISVEVTASADGYADQTLTSAAIAVPAGKIIAQKPTITGTAKVGSRLKAVTGKWSPSTVKFTFQWYAGSKPIAKATHRSLKLGKSLQGKKVRVVVSGGKVGVGAATARSAAVKVAKKK